MALASAPYRITFGGGGTDLPSYASRFGGYTITAGIGQRVHVWLTASACPHDVGAEPDDLTKAALVYLGIPDHRVCSHGDLPSGAGLGSSGAYLVALALAAHGVADGPGARPSPAEVADVAYRIETLAARRPAGVQDFYASAFGSLIEQTIGHDGGVRIAQLPVAAAVLAELDSRLLLAYTGLRRDSTRYLSAQARRTAADDQVTIEALDAVKDLAARARAALVSGRVDDLGSLFEEQWRAKVRRDPSTTTPEIDHAYSVALAAGAVGGKLIGAGGGGFLMLLLAPDRREYVRQALESLGCTCLRPRLGATGAELEWIRRDI